MEIKLRGHHLEGLQRYHAAPDIEYEIVANSCGKETAERDKWLHCQLCQHSPELIIKLVGSLDYICDVCHSNSKGDSCNDKKAFEHDEESIAFFGLELGKTYSTKDIAEAIFY